MPVTTGMAVNFLFSPLHPSGKVMHIIKWRSQKENNHRQSYSSPQNSRRVVGGQIKKGRGENLEEQFEAENILDTSCLMLSAIGKAESRRNRARIR